MSLPVGQILLQKGAITEEQLDESIQAQVIYGGRLGTNLIELGYIDIPTLSQCLSDKFNVPAMDDTQIKPCSKEAIDILGKKLASKYHCVPLSLEGARLSLLMENPGDLAALDDIAFATGKKIKPFVGPEIFIVSLMEKYYSIPRDIRFIKITLDSGPTPQNEKIKPTPGMIPTHTHFYEDEDLKEVKREDEEEAKEEEVFEIPELPPEPEHVEEEIIDLEELASEPPQVIDLTEELELPAIEPLEEKEILEELEIFEALPELLTLQEATERLADVKSREELGRIVLSFAQSYFKRSALFITRFGTAMGWECMGDGVDRKLMKAVMIPLNEPSIFKTVFDSQAFFLGAVPENRMNNRFLKFMGGGNPLSVFLIPILYKGEVVNILYGDNGDGEQAPVDISDLLILAPKVPQAFESLIQQAKAQETASS